MTARTAYEREGGACPKCGGRTEYILSLECVDFCHPCNRLPQPKWLIDDEQQVKP